MEGPEEFNSVRALLRKTDNDEFGGHNRYIWQVTRKDVLGEREKKPEVDRQYELDLPLSEFEREFIVDGVRTHHIHIRFVSPEEPVAHDPLAPLRYGWEKAPPFYALVETAAKAARDFKPRETGMVAAGLESRQGNVKTQYVRALAYLLLTSNKFNLTNRLIRAIAVIATVVINLPDADVTYDDVRKALTAQIQNWKTQDKKQD